MKFTALLVILGLIVSVSCDCTDKGKTYKAGETWTPEGECAQNTCQEAGDINQIICPPHRPLLNKDDYNLVPVDTTKPYPQCCGGFVKKN